MTEHPDEPGIAGTKIVITRMSNQGGKLRRLLIEAGGVDVSVPLIALAPASDDGAALQSAIDRVGEYRWLVITSPNGADAVAGALADSSDPQVLPPVAAIGPGTADRLAQHDISVAFVPDRSVGEGLVEEFPLPDGGDRSILVVQAEAARPVVVDGLQAKGWTVTWAAGYRTVDAVVTDEQRRQIGAADMVTFTSSSTVDRFCDLVGLDYLPPVVASIGPITTATAQARGIDVTIEAETHTIDGMVDAIRRYRA